MLFKIDTENGIMRCIWHSLYSVSFYSNGREVSKMGSGALPKSSIQKDAINDVLLKK